MDETGAIIAQRSGQPGDFFYVAKRSEKRHAAPRPKLARTATAHTPHAVRRDRPAERLTMVSCNSRRGPGWAGDTKSSVRAEEARHRLASFVGSWATRLEQNGGW